MLPLVALIFVLCLMALGRDADHADTHGLARVRCHSSVGLVGGVESIGRRKRDGGRIVGKGLSLIHI